MNGCMRFVQCNHAGTCLHFRLIAHYMSVIEFWSTDMNILRNISAWRRYRATYNQLNRLSDRELNDVGLTRFDIDRIARQGA